MCFLWLLRVVYFPINILFDEFLAHTNTCDEYNIISFAGALDVKIFLSSSSHVKCIFAHRKRCWVSFIIEFRYEYRISIKYSIVSSLLSLNMIAMSESDEMIWSLIRWHVFASKKHSLCFYKLVNFLGYFLILDILSKEIFPPSFQVLLLQVFV